MSTPAIFCCPRCSRALAPADGALRCDCGWATDRADVIDFTASDASEEQAHYDEVYAASESPPPLPPSELAALWTTPYYPMNSLVLEQVGDVDGKVVLLVGNGASEKELFFLERGPALLLFSDLSPTAVRRVRDRYGPIVGERVVFTALDAQTLPLVDEQVDLVYAYAVVHHLPNVAGFLEEVARVLRPGGRAVFMDDAYSPAWQFAKRTFLRPLVRCFHRIEPISPEDARFTMGGGFKEEELAARIRAVGGEPWFLRSSLVHYLVTRASERLPPRALWSRVPESDRLLRALIAVDDALGRIPAVRRNQIRLVWGFDKPAALHSPPT